jgi:adenine deaminase
VWKVIYVASNWKEADEMKDRLAREGLMVMLRSGSRDKHTSRHVELLVPRLEAREAHSIIMQYIGTARV